MTATVEITYSTVDGEGAEDGGARQRALDVLDLLGRHGGRLEPQERPQRQRGRERDGVQVAHQAAVVRVEGREVGGVM